MDDYAENIVAQKLSSMPGVGSVNIGGAQTPAIQIQLNPAQLAEDGLDLEAVRMALANDSVDQPKGTLYSKQDAYTLQTDDQLLSPDKWNNQIIAYRNGGPIRVRDVGKAVVGSEYITVRGWVNHSPGVVLAVEPLPAAPT